MPHTMRCAAALATVACAVTAPGVAAREHPRRACTAAVCSVAPPSSPREFLELAGVPPVPGVGDLAAIRRARCTNPEAAAEAGDCPAPPALGVDGGGGRLMMTSMG